MNFSEKSSPLFYGLFLHELISPDLPSEYLVNKHPKFEHHVTLQFGGFNADLEKLIDHVFEVEVLCVYANADYVCAEVKLPDALPYHNPSPAHITLAHRMGCAPKWSYSVLRTHDIAVSHSAKVKGCVKRVNR